MLLWLLLLRTSRLHEFVLFDPFNGFEISFALLGIVCYLEFMIQEFPFSFIMQRGCYYSVFVHFILYRCGLLFRFQQIRLWFIYVFLNHWFTRCHLFVVRVVKLCFGVMFARFWCKILPLSREYQNDLHPFLLS